MLYSIFPSTAVCSSSLLRANLSTCKEGIRDEALKLIVNHRLRGNEWKETDQSTSKLTSNDPILLCPQYDTMDGQTPTGKYITLAICLLLVINAIFGGAFDKKPKKKDVQAEAEEEPKAEENEISRSEENDSQNNLE